MRGRRRPDDGLVRWDGWTYSEQHRHECEVRYVAGMSTREQRRAYLDGVRAKRGAAAADKLRDDVLRAWADRHGAPSSAPPSVEDR